MDQMIFSTAEAAKALRLSPSTLNKLRVSGNGPRFVKLGRRVVYLGTDLAEWINSHRRDSTSQH